MSNRVHELKIEKDYADSVYLGDKNFEIRFNDRGFQKGDIIRFLPLGKKPYAQCVDTEHPLYRKEYEITYVIGSFVGITHGYVAFGIKPIHKGGDTE